MKDQPHLGASESEISPLAPNQHPEIDAVTPPWIDFGAPQISPVNTFSWMSSVEEKKTVDGSASTQARQAAARGDALVAQGQFRASLDHFHEAVWLCPTSPEFHYRLAGAAEKAARRDLLDRHLHEAIRLDPCFVPAHHSLGKLCRMDGEVEKALYHSAITVTLAPRDPRYIAEHGMVLVMSGQPNEAWELIEPLIAQPGPIYRWIATLYARIAPILHHEERALAVVERALKAPDLHATRDGRPLLQFAAATLLDRLGRYDEAFEYIRIANDAIRGTSTTPHDPVGHSNWISDKISHFSAERLQSLPRATHGSRRPVLIVGMPRSGTSLVEQILGSHPAVFPGGEMDTLSHIPNGQINDWAEGELYPQCLDLLSVKMANRLASRYLSKIDSMNADATYVTDKMPANFLGLEIAEIFLPGCHVINCVRTPLDMCLSCYMTNFAIRNEFSLDLEHLGAYYRDYRRIMDHWKKVLDIKILDVRYEDLVLDTEGQVRRMLDFLDLPWNDKCLDFHRSKRPVRTASEDQVRLPIYTSSIGRWKHYEAHLGPLFASLGGSTASGAANSSSAPALTKTASTQASK